MVRIPTIDEVLERARARLERVAPSNLEGEMAAGALVVDVRTSEQRGRDGELPGAVPIDLTVLEWRLAPSSRHRELEIPPDGKVILVCSQGFSSSLAAARLQDLGLTRATDLVGGFTAWKSWKDGATNLDTVASKSDSGDVGE
jgi:rhodanese-related sulfurtransferase